MKRKIFKIFFIFQYEKEEKWLNEMSAKGFQLTDVGFCTYTFTEGTPGEYIYRLELLDNAPSSAMGFAYISFLEDTGAEFVGSMNKWIYVRREAKKGPFNLHSDLVSKLKYVAKIRNLMLCLFLCFIPIILLYFNNIKALMDGASIASFALLVLVEVLFGVGALFTQFKVSALRKELLYRE